MHGGTSLSALLRMLTKFGVEETLFLGLRGLESEWDS